MSALAPESFDPHGGDHRSTPGRFGPLAVDHPSVDQPCVVCSERMLPGDVPTLISLAPADLGEALKKTAGKAYTAVAGIAHQDCAWPGESRRP